MGLVLGYFAGIAAATAPLNPYIPEGWRWVSLALGVVILLAAGVYHWWAWVNRIRVCIRATGRLPGYFRIGARDQTDLDSFSRQDGCQDRFVTWIKGAAAEPVLYVIGRSGVGKSSLVHAYAIPKLSKQQWLVISLDASGEDALTQLRERLRACWKQPPNDVWTAPLPDLLERAASRVQKEAEGKSRLQAGGKDQPVVDQVPTEARLLIVLDQFDQLLAVAGQDPDRIRAAVEMLGAIRKKMPKRVTVLVVLRDDFIPDFASFLRAQGLPEIEEPGNAYRVLGFTLDAAREFLQATAGGLDFDPEFLGRVIRRLNDQDDGGGVIRPIALNMCGWYFQRFVLSTGSASPTILGADPIHDFIRQVVDQKKVRQHGPVLLKAMITDRKTMRRRELDDLASEVMLAPAEVRACLIELRYEGLVRRVGGDVWEVAHDFLAEILADVLGSPHKGILGRLWKRNPSSDQRWYELYSRDDVRQVSPSGDTVLHVTIRDSDDEKAVEHILKLGADVTAADANGDTAFHHAAREGKAGVLKELSKWTDGTRFQNRAGRTPLHVAAEHGRDACAALLLAFGSDVAATDQRGKTPLHLAAGGGHVMTAERLMASTPPPDPSARDRQDRTPLHDARGREMIDWLLVRADPNVWTAGGDSPLRQAAMNDDPLMVEVLLTHPTHPADPNAIPEPLDFAPLHVAAHWGAARAARALLDHGADPNLPNRDDGFAPLHIAARHDQLAVAEVLLSDPRTELNPRGLSGKTPLHISASRSGGSLVGELLLRRGADPNVAANEAWPPLKAALCYCNYGLARLMLERGADPNGGRADISPLTDAVIQGALELVELLVRHGAEPSQALEFAEKNTADAAILEVLRRAATG